MSVWWLAGRSLKLGLRGRSFAEFLVVWEVGIGGVRLGVAGGGGCVSACS